MVHGSLESLVDTLGFSRIGGVGDSIVSTLRTLKQLRIGLWVMHATHAINPNPICRLYWKLGARVGLA